MQLDVLHAGKQTPERHGPGPKELLKKRLRRPRRRGLPDSWSSMPR
jgi:hypothetical protein